MSKRKPTKQEIFDRTADLVDAFIDDALANKGVKLKVLVECLIYAGCEQQCAIDIWTARRVIMEQIADYFSAGPLAETPCWFGENEQ